MDFSRQLEVFDPASLRDRVNVIGCGASGSWVVLLLAKMGVNDIHIYDFDIVEEHNLPNQCFGLTDVGISKVCGLAARVLADTGSTVTVHDEEVTGETKLTGVVFILTDTMSSRADIYNKAIKHNMGVKLLIETRMGAESGRVYTLDPKNPLFAHKYKETLYSDEEATRSVCKIAQTLAPTAMMIASHAVWQLIKATSGSPYENEIIFDLKSGVHISSCF